MFTTKFHVKERTMDLVRRRRWHRKLVQESSDADAPVFKMDVGDVSFFFIMDLYYDGIYC